MRYATLDRPGKVHLDELPTDPPRSADRAQAEARIAELSKELFELQDLLWGARAHAVLVVLQGMDTAGKDGAIKHMTASLNARGVSVVSFGVPTPEESEHDFLWRVHQHAPRKGEVAIFNRSHYEDVLVARVRDLVPASLWKERYDHINDFEELLAEHGTIILKFFLHISKAEQKERLLARETEPGKSWKLNVGDWRDRERWSDYTAAYEDALGKCASKHAPWIVVPANAKWYRNVVVIETVVETLRPYRKGWQKDLDERGERALAELLAYRAASGK